MTVRNYVANTSVTSLVQAPNGSAAWIRATDSGAAVSKFEAATGTAMVDPGPTVAIHSLALATGSQLYPGADAAIYWINSGQAFSA
jgi:hypothetical protein